MYSSVLLAAATASLTASSFPLIPTWLGIHNNLALLLLPLSALILCSHPYTPDDYFSHSSTVAIHYESLTITNRDPSSDSASLTAIRIACASAENIDSSLGSVAILLPPLYATAAPFLLDTSVKILA